MSNCFCILIDASIYISFYLIKMLRGEELYFNFGDGLRFDSLKASFEVVGISNEMKLVVSGSQTAIRILWYLS